jgi:CRP/FNR family cyclic AMP-dependent transcriptional regulator
VRPVEELLRDNAIFAAGGAALAALLLHAEEHQYEMDELVLRDGEQSGRIFVLLEGTVRVFHASPSGDEVTVKIFAAPAVFGEAESFARIPFVENVAALKPARVLVVSLATFVAYLVARPEAAIAMLADVSQRLAIAAYDEKSIAFHTITMRLANHLLDLAELDPRGRIRASQEQMAAAIGATRRSVAKDVAAWLRDGVLSRDRAGYRIADLARLRTFADETRLALTHRMSPLNAGR